jgi:hypothetical protein
MNVGDRYLRGPFWNVNGLTSCRRWPKHLFRRAADIERSGGSVSRFAMTTKGMPPYTGGYNRRVSDISGTSVTRLSHEGHRRISPFITALRYFISLTFSKVGACSGPSTLRISTRNLCKTSGWSASIATANVRVDAVCSKAC